MKSITINGSKRESVGKKSTNALRNAGKVPCVVYGGEKPIHFSADELSFSKLVYTPDAHTVVIELEDENKIDAINKAKINNNFPKSRFLKTKEKSWKNVSILEIKLFIHIKSSK